VSWVCPKCGDTDLKVDIVINIRARLMQEEDGNFQTDEDGGDHEWGGSSMMECCNCGHEDKSRKFEVPDDYLQMRKFIRGIAEMNHDGEEREGIDEPFVMENDDAVSDLGSLIHQARDIIGKS
jgi:hypothetical protein